MRIAGVLFLLLVTTTTTAMAQTRTNTKDLGRKLQDQAEQKRKEAGQLEAKAKAAQEAVSLARKKISENDRHLDQLDQELLRIKEEKAKLLGEIVWELMNHPEIGKLLRENPSRIRLIPGIQEILEAQPWLDPVLDEILKEYRQ